MIDISPLQQLMRTNRVIQGWKQYAIAAPVCSPKQRYKEAIGRYREAIEEGRTGYTAARIALRYAYYPEWTHKTAKEGRTEPTSSEEDILSIVRGHLEEL